METYIISVVAKPGHEDDVARFFKGVESLSTDARTFANAKSFKRGPRHGGRRLETVYAGRISQPSRTAPRGSGDPVHRDRKMGHIEDCMLCSKNIEMNVRGEGLIPHLLPEPIFD